VSNPPPRQHESLSCKHSFLSLTNGHRKQRIPGTPLPWDEAHKCLLFEPTNACFSISGASILTVPGELVFGLRLGLGVHASGFEAWGSGMGDGDRGFWGLFELGFDGNKKKEREKGVCSMTTIPECAALLGMYP
jgi:hypothetical protein